MKGRGRPTRAVIFYPVKVFMVAPLPVQYNHFGAQARNSITSGALWLMLREVELLGLVLNFVFMHKEAKRVQPRLGVTKTDIKGGERVGSSLALAAAICRQG